MDAELESLLEQAKKEGRIVSEDEALRIVISKLQEAGDNCMPFDMNIFGNYFFNLFFSNRDFRHEIRRRFELGNLISEYGLPSNYHILELNPEAGIEDMISVYKNLLRKGISSVEGDCKKGLVLLKGDELIEKYEKELKNNGVQFSRSWKNEHSEYRTVLSLGEKFGKTYEMIKTENGWIYSLMKN